MQKIIKIETNGFGLYEFTKEVVKFAAEANQKVGLLNLFVRHTSCSLLIQENADPDVQKDLMEFFSRLVPQNMSWVRHILEGADDMPAHIKSALTNVSISIPLADSKPMLGTWQGIFLFEHRHYPHSREIIMHITA